LIELIDWNGSAGADLNGPGTANDRPALLGRGRPGREHDVDTGVADKEKNR
jgi:hypothetical protein